MTNPLADLDELYKKYKKAKGIIAPKNATKKLRLKTWKGEDTIKDLRLLEALFSVSEEREIFSPEGFTVYDYQEVVYRMLASESDKNEAFVQDAFKRLEEFYNLESSYKYSALKEMVEEGKQSFYHNGIFLFPRRRTKDDFFARLERADDIEQEDMDSLNEILDNLLQRISLYYQDRVFAADIERATMLFAYGYEAQSPTDEEFQFRFWDFFLFDYHLMLNDEKPLAYYFRVEGDTLTPTESDIMMDLLKSRFSVFRVDGMADGYSACRDIFTDETFELPTPDVYFDHRKTLLFGHVHEHGVMLLNHITTQPVTPLLGRRIKEEVLRLYELFKYRMPGATYRDFFDREAAAVRALIFVLTDYAQLKILPSKKFSFPQIENMELPAAFFAAEKKISEAAFELGLSRYAVGLLQKLYGDFFSLSHLAERTKKSSPALCAALFVFAKINGWEVILRQEIFSLFSARRDKVFPLIAEIESVLKCGRNDPRYITEEANAAQMRPW